MGAAAAGGGGAGIGGAAGAGPGWAAAAAGKAKLSKSAGRARGVRRCMAEALGVNAAIRGGGILIGSPFRKSEIPILKFQAVGRPLGIWELEFGFSRPAGLDGA